MRRTQTLARVFSVLDHSWKTRRRLQECAALFVGTPYCSNPIGGAPGELDPPAYSLDCFDCVTFVETAAAIALSRTPVDYPIRLDRMRYLGSSSFWTNRLHYFSLWLDSNRSKGIIEPILPRDEGVIVSRRLDIVKGVSVENVKIVAHRWEEPADAASADIIAFVSVQPNLDVFHVGILADEGKTLFHASESGGQVAGEPLTDFLAGEDGAGLLLARIVERNSDSAVHHSLLDTQPSAIGSDNMKMEL